MNIRPFAVALVMLSLPGVAAAQQENSGSSSEAPVGPGTRAWMELQASGSAASATARPMSGDIAERVYQRHADSFAQPIPQSLGRQGFVEEGGGSGGGGGK